MLATMERQELERLRVRVRELEEEIAEWRRQGKPGRGDTGVYERAQRARDAMPGLTLGRLFILLALIDAQGATVDRNRLLNHYLQAPGCDPDADHFHSVNVMLVALRKGLAQAGFSGAIVTVWGVGWRLDAAVGRKIKALWGEA